MNLILSGRDIGASDLKRVGGKAVALAALARAGFTIPNFFCVTTDAYQAFVDGTGLRATGCSRRWRNRCGANPI